MLKRTSLPLFFVLLFIPHVVLAWGFGDVVRSLAQIYNIDLETQHIDQAQLNQLNAMVNGLTGTHHYGSLDNDNQQFLWGNGTDSWANVLTLYQSHSYGALANVSSQLEHEFPIADHLGSVNETENQYYRLQAQTTLASRSSSQLAFDEVSKESNVINTLQRQIDEAGDTKSSLDLNNRMASEQNKMSIVQTKLLAALLQQTAVESQERANRTKENAEFFNVHY